MAQGLRPTSLPRLVIVLGWEEVPEKLVLYDYIGCNPAKGIPKCSIFRLVNTTMYVINT